MQDEKLQRVYNCGLNFVQDVSLHEEAAKANKLALQLQQEMED